MRLHITLTNEDEGYRFSDWCEDTAEWWNDPETPGEVFRELRSEYGRCISKVYVDTDEGAKPIGWVFEKRNTYDRSEDTYLQHAWVMYA